MKAEEARKITRENLKGPVIQPYLAFIYSQILQAAQNGQFSMANPFVCGERDEKLPWPSIDMEKVIFQKLTEEGYSVVQHPDPDPGHPCSAPYTTISW